MGTTGDDNFHFKVSADGLAWIEALLLNRMTGRATFPAASIAAGAQTATPFTIVGGANPASAGMQIETTSDAANCVFAFRDNSPGQGRLTVFNFINGAGLAVGSLQYQFNATGASQFMRLKVNDLEVMRWTGNTNVLIGGTADPAGASKALALFNGVAPTGSVADGVALYAEDVAGSSELKVRDEAGNVTTLSPHNFSRIPEGPSEPMAWAYHCERDGTTISVDMLKVVRLVERLAGERLVHERSEHKLTG
jgi:hypothetical protein